MSQLNSGWLRDKRLQIVAKGLSALLGSILLFAGLVNLFGYFYTIAISIIGFLALWIIVSQAIEKASPQSQQTSSTIPKTSNALAMRTRIIVPPILHSACDPGPHKVDVGEILSIPLKVKQGQRVRGHLEEVNGQPFDWYIADEKNMVLLKKGERRKFKAITQGEDDPAYTVNRKIPWNARWFLILDTYGKQYSRKVRVDFEQIPD